MPRHPIDLELPIDWDLRPPRRLLARRSGPAPALIREISLLGALVDAPVPPCRRVGERLEIRMRGRSATVEIRHVRPAMVPGRALYGVMFVDSREIDDDVHTILAHLRRERGLMGTDESVAAAGT